MAVRAILLDAVGTLIAPEPNVARAYSLAAARHGCALPETEVRQRFRDAFAAQETIDRTVHRWRTDEARERVRWRDIVAATFPECAAQAELLDDLWRHFADARHWHVDAKLLTRIDGWLAEGITVGIASNFDERLAGICRSLGEPLSRLPLYISSSIGWRKPAAEFFAAIETSLGFAHHELMLVGDDVDNDIQPAQARGWQTAHWSFGW